MQLNFSEFIYTLSNALDAAEKEYTGANTEHGKRVGWLTWLCASSLDLEPEVISEAVSVAILHDNAIAEYLREEQELNTQRSWVKVPNVHENFEDVSIHAYLGEKNVKTLPFDTDISDIILYHHENADGSGPFGKKESETNLFSQIVHLADILDVAYDFTTMTEEEYQKVRLFVRRETGTIFSYEASYLFLDNVTYDKIQFMQMMGPLLVLQNHVKLISREYSVEEMTHIAEFFANIVDYKSAFTKDHSIGVAQKAETMAEYYQFDHDKLVRFAFAGALHDIGKMTVGNDILEKPDKLTANEFGKMKNHAAETYRILNMITDFDDIRDWASNHHEKLDGTGYSRNLTGDQMDFESRLMACIDIYQALTENRPYKDGLSHRRSIKIMTEMADEGKIDTQIVKDMDIVFGKDQQDDAEDDSNARIVTKRWKCSVCGYIYEGDTPPATCPICDSEHDQFNLLDD